MRTLVSIIVIFLAAVSTCSQTLPRVKPCKVTVETLPPIRDLRLGMPFSTVRAMFKNLVGDATSDERGSRIHLVTEILQPEFSDVRKISFVFIDDELERFELSYKLGTNFTSIELYSSKLSNSLTLPRDGWRYTTKESSDARSGLASMQCYGFGVKATLVNIGEDQSATLELESATLIPTLINRARELEKRKARKQDRTNEFKP